MKRLIALVFCLAAATGFAQQGTKNGEWRTYGGDLGSTRYAPLSQINADNFSKLEVAWRLKTEHFGPRPEYQFESTPLMVKGVIYTTAGSRRAAVAVDAATGEVIWSHTENEGERARNAPRQLSGHGLAYWTDGKEERILYVTPGYRMIALDAKTGSPVKTFGKDGVVDLKLDDDQEIDLIKGDVGLHATPIVAKNVVIIGAAHLSGDVPRTHNNVIGYVRGFDVKTGKRLWIFHTIPRPGEFGYNTWENDSASKSGNTGAWGQISVDEQLGLAYIPVELPTGDYVGIYRQGNALFGESIVAVDLQTGKRKWHYQLVHHGLWDMDIPCAPMLVDIPVNGKTVKAVAQPTKQGWLYVFNRENGQPIWPMPETPVEKGNVPGEWYSPTQPIPSKPPAYELQGVEPDGLINFTPELHAEALKLVEKYKIGPLFTAPVVSQQPGPLGTLHTPGSQGGTNWPGGSYDPETHMVYVFSKREVSLLGVVPNDNKDFSDFAYIHGVAGQTARRGAAMGAAPANPSPAAAAAAANGGEGGGPGITVRGLPLLKPPYGSITAIDLTKGDIAWQIAHGETPDQIRNNPALKGVTIPRTGRVGNLGPLTTKTLVICGEAGFGPTPSGARGAMLRAYDKASGKEVGAVYMPAPQTGSPMTYELNGEQYLIVAVGGSGYPAELLAYKLPKS